MSLLPTALHELLGYRQWVCHRNKVPLNPRTGDGASVTNPSDWGSYEEAIAYAASHNGVGIGFVLTTADPFACIDLDTHKTTDPTIIGRHNEIYNSFDSYCETSPSGKGAHIWVKGSIPSSTRSSHQHIEIYANERYMTLTGNAVKNVPIANCNGKLTRLWEQLQPQRAKGDGPFSSQPQTQSDDCVIQLCMRVATAAQFQTLWAGDISQHDNDGSAADLALMNLIAFHTDNKEQCIRIFRQSGLAQRVKDGKVKSNRDDYMKRTVDKAFDQKVPTSDALRDMVARMDPRIQSNVPLPHPLQIANADELEVIEMADTEIERIEWLVPDFVPKGKLTLVAGAGETGKTSLVLSLAAIASMGGTWPDGAPCETAGSVLIFSTEDDAPTTIFPRLIAMGANPKNIAVVAYNTSANKAKRRFDPAIDMPVLERHAIARGNVSLIVIDPITSAVTGDMNKTNEVRRGLQSVVETAAKVNCAVIGITHFTKNSEGRNPADRVIGSQAFAAYARMVLVAARDEQSSKRVLTRAKSNISLTGGGFSYLLREVVLAEKNIKTLAVVWGEQLQGSAREILASVEHKDEKDESAAHTQMDEAQAFLKEALKDGQRYQKHLVDEAKERLGIQERTLQRARQRLGVTTRKQSNGNWMWSLAPEPPDKT
jgi:putative DNA primase/helicase